MLAGLGAGMSEAVIAVTPSETIKQVLLLFQLFSLFLLVGENMITGGLCKWRLRKKADRYGDTGQR